MLWKVEAASNSPYLCFSLVLVISFVMVERTEKPDELPFHRLRLKALQVSSLYGTPEGVP